MLSLTLVFGVKSIGASQRRSDLHISIQEMLDFSDVLKWSI